MDKYSGFKAKGIEIAALKANETAEKSALSLDVVGDVEERQTRL